MHELQTVEYMNQMDNNIGDKSKMLKWITGSKVLDAGCGGGALTDELYNTHGYDAYGIDLSLLSYKSMYDRGLQKRFVHGNLLDMSLYFDEGAFDTIIFSSVLHEVFSYNGFNYGCVEETLENAMKILPKGGRIIIRDGVKSPTHSYRRIRFKDANDILFLTEYCRRFKGRRVNYKVVDKNTFEMLTNDAMEFLYTYTWGWDSFDREVQEQYGVFSLAKYEALAKRIGGEVLFSQEYLQKDYTKHLREKVVFMNEKGYPVDLPSSNMILVIEKK
ncbi:hypothetical protein BCSAG_49700 [Bacillus cereus]|uniref:methyltransferase domain-containing protein n=1 Tax=Bacillus cereus TaxID=1396 RepID=UPI00397FAE04